MLTYCKINAVIFSFLLLLPLLLTLCVIFLHFSVNLRLSTLPFGIFQSSSSHLRSWSLCKVLAALSCWSWFEPPAARGPPAGGTPLSSPGHHRFCLRKHTQHLVRSLTGRCSPWKCRKPLLGSRFQAVRMEITTERNDPVISSVQVLDFFHGM